MNKQQKKARIISCYGHVTMKSTAAMCGVHHSYVRYVWDSCGFNTIIGPKYNKKGEKR